MSNYVYPLFLYSKNCTLCSLLVLKSDAAHLFRFVFALEHGGGAGASALTPHPHTPLKSPFPPPPLIQHILTCLHYLQAEAIEAIEATRSRRVCQLERITPGPSTRAPASRRPLTAVVRLAELGEAGVVSLASTPPSSLLPPHDRRVSQFAPWRHNHPTSSGKSTNRAHHASALSRSKLLLLPFSSSHLILSTRS